MDFGGRILLLLNGYSVYFILGLMGAVVCLTVWNFSLAFRIRAADRKRKVRADVASDPESLEECIAAIQRLDKMAELQARNAETARAHWLAVQKLGLLRFDAFDDIGGEQSFALALLDAEANGVVVSSLFGRSECRVYAKPIKGGSSEHVLSSEEQEAVKKALGS